VGNHNGHNRGLSGRFVGSSFDAVYAEINRLDELRQADKEAVAAALVAADAKAAASVLSAKEAVSKSEDAQLRVNKTQNEFRGSLDDYTKLMMPRNEAENVERELRGLIAINSKEIGDLRSRLDIGPEGLTILQKRSDEAAGAKKGSDETLAKVVTWAVAGATIGGIVVGVILKLVGG
jgi:hypothetical protein